MLRCACDDVVSLVSTSVSDAPDSEVVRFSRATRKNISSAEHPSSPATWLRAFSTASFAVVPNGCALEALPKCVVR